VQGDAVCGVACKETSADLGGGGGEGEDGGEDGGVVDVGAEGVVFECGLLPRVANARQVYEDDTEGPQVCLNSRVVVDRLKEAALALRGEIEGRATGMSARSSTIQRL
jgi:hypothetical protein